MSGLVTATISGQEVIANGTLVVPPQQTAMLHAGGQMYTLIFGKSFPGSNHGPTFNATNGLGGAVLNLMDFDNPLGTHVDIKGLTVAGAPANLSLVVYSIGDDNPARVIHYSFYRAPSSYGGLFGRRGLAGNIGSPVAGPGGLFGGSADTKR